MWISGGPIHEILWIKTWSACEEHAKCTYDFSCSLESGGWSIRKSAFPLPRGAPKVCKRMTFDIWLPWHAMAWVSSCCHLWSGPLSLSPQAALCKGRQRPFWSKALARKARAVRLCVMSLSDYFNTCRHQGWKQDFGILRYGKHALTLYSDTLADVLQECWHISWPVIRDQRIPAQRQGGVDLIKLVAIS